MGSIDSVFPAGFPGEQFFDPSIFGPDGVPIEWQPADAAATSRIGFVGGKLWYGAVVAQWPIDRADGGSPDNRRLSPHCPRRDGPSAEAGATPSFRCDPVQAHGHGDCGTVVDQPAEGIAYFAAILPGSLK